MKFTDGFQAGFFSFALLVSTLITSVVAEEKVYLLDQYAPTSEQLAEWEESHDKLVHFEATPEYSNRDVSKTDHKIRGELTDNCFSKTLNICQKYIKANRVAVLDALPNNPLYWQRFWDYIDSGPGSNLQSSGDSSSYPQALFHAADYWFYRELIQYGKVDGDRGIAIQRFISKARKAPHSLKTRMIAITLQVFTQKQISFLMAQFDRDRDTVRLRRLGQLLRPPTVEEISWASLLWWERENQIKQNFELYPETMKELSANPGQALKNFEEIASEAGRVLEPKHIEMAKILDKGPKVALSEGMDALAEIFIPQSTLPWQHQWEYGLPGVARGQLEPYALQAIAAAGYQTNLLGERIHHFTLHLYPALADIYAGRVSPGLPSRPPPAHWRWLWLEGEHPQLCLVSDSVQAKEAEYFHEQDGEARVCEHYFDASFVEAFYVE